MAPRRKARKPKDDPVASELGWIKRLLMIQLVRSGVKPTDIARALGVDKREISALISVRGLSFLKQKGSASD